MIEQVLRNIDGRRQQSLKGLMDLLRIPSVSTKPDHAQDMVRCARSLADTLGATVSGSV